MKKFGIFLAGAVTGGVAVVVAEAVWFTNKVKKMTEEGLRVAEEMSEMFGDIETVEQDTETDKNKEA